MWPSSIETAWGTIRTSPTTAGRWMEESLSLVTWPLTFPSQSCSCRPCCIPASPVWESSTGRSGGLCGGTTSDPRWSTACCPSSWQDRRGWTYLRRTWRGWLGRSLRRALGGSWRRRLGWRSGDGPKDSGAFMVSPSALISTRDRQVEQTQTGL